MMSDMKRFYIILIAVLFITAGLYGEDSVEEKTNSEKGKRSRIEKQLDIIEEGIPDIESTVNEAKKIKAKPDQTDIMKAIDLDNKMAGDYATEKKEVEMDIKWTETKSYDGADEKAD